MYYLQSRYYNPEIGRFINADAFASTGQGILGNNMFAYCNNNPIRYCDPSGEVLFEAIAVAVGTEWAITIIVAGIVIISGVVFEALEMFVDWLARQWYYPFTQIRITDTSDVEIQAQVEAASEHTKNKSERNRNKHEEGNARRQRDQGGEKKKQKKGWIPNSNKRGMIGNGTFRYEIN